MRPHQRGITLLELVVTLTVLGVVAAMSVVAVRPDRSGPRVEAPMDRCRREAIERASEVAAEVDSILIRCLPDGTVIEPEPGGGSSR